MNTSRIFVANRRGFSSADGGYQANSEDIQATADLIQQLAQIKAQKDAMTAETGCKKPFINIGQKKKDYEKCLSDSARKKQELLDRQEEILRQQRELQERRENSKPDEKKFLGMPQEIGIPVTIIVGLGIIFFGYKGIKHLTNKITTKK